jgi:hypothetical protein
LFLKRLRGESADISAAFSGFTMALVPLILASLIGHALTLVGFFLCVLPGIYLLVAWWLFTPLLILDKHLDFWPALECSRKVVTHHWLPCFGLALVVCLVALVGSLACGIGIFFTMPIAVGAMVVAYEDIFGARAATTGLLSPPEPTPTVPAPAAPTPTPVSPPASESNAAAPSPETGQEPTPSESGPTSPPAERV